MDECRDEHFNGVCDNVEAISMFRLTEYVAVVTENKENLQESFYNGMKTEKL